MKRPDIKDLQNTERMWRKRDVLNLFNLLSRMRGVRGVQFLATCGLILENIRWIDRFTTARCITSFDAYVKYEHEVSALQRKHNIISDKDILENTAYQAELRELNRVNEDVIRSYHEDLREYNMMMEEPAYEIPFNWPSIDKDSIPESIPSELYFALLPLMSGIKE